MDYQVLVPSEPFPSDSIVNVLLVLDGDEYAPMARNVLDLYEFDQSAKSTVMISLPSTQKSRWMNYTASTCDPRSDLYSKEDCDSTGEFFNLSDFIEHELMPKIESDLGFKFYEKIIFGHSMGGLEVLNFLVYRPLLFDHCISASPSTMYDDHALF